MTALEARQHRRILQLAGHHGLIECRRRGKWRARCACGHIARWNGTQTAAVDTLLTHLSTAARRLHANGY